MTFLSLLSQNELHGAVDHAIFHEVVGLMYEPVEVVKSHRIRGHEVLDQFLRAVGCSAIGAFDSVFSGERTDLPLDTR